MQKRKVVVLLSQLWDERSSMNKRARNDALAYIERKGWSAYGDPETLTVQGRLLAGGEPNAIFETLPAGTIAVVPTLEHLAGSASDLRDGLFKVIGSGVELHVCELGPVSEKLEPLMRGLAFSIATEKRLRAEEASHAESETQWARLFEQYRKDLTARLVTKWGLPAQGISPDDLRLPSEIEAAFKGALPHAAEPESDVDLSALGSYIRAAREALDWKQPMLADALGVSVSVVSRLESTGKGPHALAAIEKLAGADEAQTFKSLAPAGQALLATKRVEGLESASAGRLPVWTPEAGAPAAAA